MSIVSKSMSECNAAKRGEDNATGLDSLNVCAQLEEADGT